MNRARSMAKLPRHEGGAQPAVPAGDAQSPVQAPTQQPAAAAPVTDPPVVEEVGWIAEIIVTATRREEKLQQIPVTVTAITGQARRVSSTLRA